MLNLLIFSELYFCHVLKDTLMNFVLELTVHKAKQQYSIT
jgi:hypothetical protein